MTSSYSKTLAHFRTKSCHFLKDLGDQWCTPDLLFFGINAVFGPLVLDLFADDSNAKCPAWYTAEDNALTQDWSARHLPIRPTAGHSTTTSRQSLAWASS